MKIILICATTLDGYISRHSNEITNWTKDLKLFKKQTMGYPVIMGSNTFKTLQNELTGRNVIVFHRYDNPNTITFLPVNSFCNVLNVLEPIITG